MATFFITGISTDVGKTIAAAIVTEALEADYWKPVQAGELENSDTKKVKRLISNTKSNFHKSAYNLNAPISPHASADLDGISIKMNEIKSPKTVNHLVVEGAGGLLVPLNNKKTVMDLIQPKDHVILVSRHYLGSINHTLLTLDKLKDLPNKVQIIFSGEEQPSTESIIKGMTGISVIGRIEQEPFFDKNVIKEYAEKFRTKLL